ncbi:DUF418 domain-containing protein [uncultured Agrococcus sp.]|uniref:DUF418 domain-containing protein n=1 Tax=uncultured Agrococcus sp. TaxID=382258 RepID=UPI0025DA0D00|nr:DUF418 domain-containing protein [uncultured Agrococcus sp.]
MNAATGAPQPSAPSGHNPSVRSLAPDLARGLMLMLIAAANVSWFLWGRESSETGVHLTDGSILDRVAQFVMIVTVDGRIYPLFAFLFGYGMVQFVRSRLGRDEPYPEVRRMLRRRHWTMLLLIGPLHAALLFMGDIVAAYGLVALILVGIFFDRQERTLWICVWILVGLWALNAVFSIMGGVGMALFSPDLIPLMSKGMPDIQGMTVGQENYLWSIVGRLGMWAMGGLTQGIISAVPITILLGWIAARRGILDNPAAHKPLLQRVALFGIAIGWLGGLPSALTHVGVLTVPSWTFTGLDTIAGAAGAVGYVALFGLLAAHWQSAPPAPIRWVAAVGKRSLTFYLWQSLIFAPLFSAWGFGVGGTVGTAGALGIAMLVWLASVPIAVLLERRGARGPAEAVLRRITYGRVGTSGMNAGAQYPNGRPEAPPPYPPPGAEQLQGAHPNVDHPQTERIPGPEQDR